MSTDKRKAQLRESQARSRAKKEAEGWKRFDRVVKLEWFIKLDRLLKQLREGN